MLPRCTQVPRAPPELFQTRPLLSQLHYCLPVTAFHLSNLQNALQLLDLDIPGCNSIHAVHRYCPGSCYSHATVKCPGRIL